jgi:hypothetical protein
MRRPPISTGRSRTWSRAIASARPGPGRAWTALCKPNQIKVHVAGALANGCSVEEIRETFLHTMVYAGVPCGVEAFNAAAEVLARHLAGAKP